MNYKQPVSVLVVIYTPQLQVLLLERARHPGFWQSVTGSREGAETLDQCALRECAEETGIAVPPARLMDWHLHNLFPLLPLWRHHYDPQVKENTEHVFSYCAPEQSAIVLRQEEHRAWAWLDWQEAAHRVFSWSNRDAILMLPGMLQDGLSPSPS